MASTVRISDETKRKMQQLIRFLNFKGNRKISQTEVLDIVIEAGIQNKEQLLKFLASNDQPTDWKKDPIFQDVGLEMDEDTSERVDEIIYGKYE